VHSSSLVLALPDGGILMNTPLNHMLDLLGLTDGQRQAASERTKNTIVTAGAGSGKTSTLVARYLGLLSEGLLPRQVVAVTFTEKAAREMRSRARKQLHLLLLKASSAAEQQSWAGLDAQMDSARIGTIHSLCAEILRSQPAAAGLDPRFIVVEENKTAALRAQAVQEALVWSVQQEQMTGLFGVFSIRRLEELLGTFLSKRLEVSPGSFDPSHLTQTISPELLRFLHDDATVSVCTELRTALTSHTLLEDAGDKLAAQVEEMLFKLETAEAALEKGDSTGAALSLFQARRENMILNVGKKARTREALQELRDRYDVLLGPWLGGADAKDAPPDPQVEAAILEALPLLAKLNEKTLALYRKALDEQNGLDFDDLEAGTVSLLRDSTIRLHWQAEIAAVLVDEFQDTNARQREIILGLCGEQPGRLFVVGDARQSIYRFRGADVTVFTSLQTQIRQQGGQAIDLDRTFRAHPSLLAGLEALLSPIMGSQADPERPFLIPYAPLRSERSEARKKMQAPYIESILGAGEDAVSARPAAARALARRLSELFQKGEILKWDEVALLFRASTPFSIYEQALEEAGIPYVTVAGSGFYDRPEVRDVLNLLRALADPWDDQAMVGLLRSPAFGVSDVGIYQLRCPKGKVRPVQEALHGDLSAISTMDQEHARRAQAILDELVPLVDRLPVAELLKRLLDRSDYRATLATLADAGDSARLWRNLDKLIGDAQDSGLVGVRGFLEYIATMRDVGAREGEAASEAEGSVRLMTIHKAKGLEIPIVVLADAARRPNPGREVAFRLGETWTVSPDKLEGTSLAFRLARAQDALQNEAEEKRLLYVALTRAQEKLIVNGHIRIKEGQAYTDGWLDALLAAGGILLNAITGETGKWQEFSLTKEASWGLWLAPVENETIKNEPKPNSTWPESLAEYLFSALPNKLVLTAIRKEHARILLEPRTPPARVAGEMVHRALQRWRFPGDPLLDQLLRTQAQMEGLYGEGLLQQAIHEAEVLLQRFRQHPLFAEMNTALERQHEVPFLSTSSQGNVEWGFMDCLYRTQAGWKLVDFKTDELRNRMALAAAQEMYTPQMIRYRQAVEQWMGIVPRTLMCFLNVERTIELVEVK
jgi:ATP-dependent helicase/nuclease subunit A